MAESWFILHITGQLVFTRNQEVSGLSCISEFTGRMIYEIFINYMTEILSLRLEITVCTLVRFRY
uniref:Uncharacterized protein n=1 Tax=Cucumis melo TaxID=3656 RepID=A0A9I9E8G8_CUCME